MAKLTHLTQNDRGRTEVPYCLAKLSGIDAYSFQLLCLYRALK